MRTADAICRSRLSLADLLQRVLKGVAAICCLAVPAFAAGQTGVAQAPLAIELSVARVLAQGAKEVLASASDARPGDVLEYRAQYRNASPAKLSGVVAMIPVPNNTVIEPNAVTPKRADASTDGVDYRAMPLMRDVVRQGKLAKVAVPLTEYRFVRWQPVDLAAGQSAEFRLRVRVEGPHAAGPS